MINAKLDFKYEDVLTRFSPSFQRKMEHSVKLLRKAERLAMAYDSEDGYFLAFSGGKDSQCLYHVAKLAGVRFRAYMNLTSVDPPEVIRFVKRHYPDVALTKPKDSIYNIAVRRKILPTMRVRWCCAEYKETAGAGKVTLIGIRRAESARRARRNEVEINNHSFSGTLDGLEEYRKEKTTRRRKNAAAHKDVTIVNADGERVLGCIHGKESLLISPIIEWTDGDVWTFLNTLGIAHCELYDQGFSRIGCILCPMSQPKQKQREMERWPHVRRNWIKAIKAIRDRGVFEGEYIWWNISKDLVPLPNVRYVLRGGTNGGIMPAASTSTTRQCGRSTPLPPPRRGRIIGSPNPRYVINPKWLQNPAQFLPKGHLEKGLATSNGASLATGFSDGSSPDRLTEEQETEIAENIFDWWISGKPYKRWYADKFLQQKLNFEEE